MNRPEFFIVGRPKCGTSALADFLDQHPDVFLPHPEEPCYFVPSWCRAEPPSTLVVRRTESEYLALFGEARADQLCGDRTAV